MEVNRLTNVIGTIVYLSGNLANLESETRLHEVKKQTIKLYIFGSLEMLTYLAVKLYNR